jgi:hypothetical protein
MLPSLVILLRAVAPSTWSQCQRVLAAVREVAALPVTLLVVPRLHGQARDRRFDDGLAWRSWLGDELALHGYMHEDSEFDQAGCDDSLQRLHAGIAWFDANEWPLAGFASPRWRLGTGAWSALKQTPLHYVLTRHGVHVLPRGDRIASHSIAWATHTAFARGVSLAWSAWPGRAGQDLAPLVRLELTPDAADHGRVREAWQRRLQHHLAYRQVQTVARAVHAWQPTLARRAAVDAGFHAPTPSARV